MKYNSINFLCKYLTEKRKQRQEYSYWFEGGGEKNVAKTKRLNIHS